MKNTAAAIKEAPLPTDITPKVEQQMTAAQAEYSRATALVVSTQPEYESAGDYIASLKATNKKLEAERTELVGPLNAVVKKINARFKTHTDALDRAIAAVNSKMVGYFREQEQIRLKAEAEAAERARKEREKLEARAAKAEEQGKVEKAAILAQQAEMVNTNPIAPVTEKQTAQTTMVRTWSCRVVDKLTLIEAVAKGEASMELLEVNMSALNGMARAQKETLNVPGCKAVFEDNIRSK